MASFPSHLSRLLPQRPSCHTKILGGPKPRRELSPGVLGSSLTHMMTHGTEMNVTSLIYNEVLYKIVK
jgi:hypothetical protein